ncbi:MULTISPECIES: hypothetical protein [Aeromicrobium]|uniref:hypothetical protein n=1 Tax=Aeromicrobium TaxID=2040 RepID=UPI00257E3FFE|nr:MULTISPECIES: hypothetical protein [Aeromicrobium]
MADPSRLVPIAGIDRLLGGSRIRQSFSPLDLPPLELLGDALVRLAAHGPHTRAGFVKADDEHWRYVGAGIAERLPEIFRVVPEGTAESAQDWLAAHLVEDLPLQFAVKGDELASAFDHVLLDAPLASSMPTIIVTMAGGAPVPSLFDTVTERPVTRALWNTFGRHPGTLLTLLRSRGAAPEVAALPAGAVEREDDRVPLVDPGHLTHRLHRSCDVEQMAGVREWGAAHGLGISPTMILLAAAATQQAGIPIEPQGDLVVDLRRYLPKGVTTGGNFITGVSVPVWGEGFEPPMVGERLSTMLDSGRPLAAVAARLLRARRRPPTAPTEADTVPRPVRARTSVSNPGVLRIYEALPWKVPPAERRVVHGTDGVVPNAIGWISSTDAGQFRVSVSFRADVFDPALVDRAATLMFTDPVGVLDAMV